MEREFLAASIAWHQSAISPAPGSQQFRSQWSLPPISTQPITSITTQARGWRFKSHEERVIAKSWLGGHHPLSSRYEAHFSSSPSALDCCLDSLDLLNPNSECSFCESFCCLLRSNLHGYFHLYWGFLYLDSSLYRQIHIGSMGIARRKCRLQRHCSASRWCGGLCQRKH